VNPAQAGLFVNDVIRPAQAALAVTLTGTHDIARLFQLPDSRPDRVDLLPVDKGQAFQRKIPILRQGQHLRQQPLGFQGQVLIPQVVVGHHRVATVFLHSKNCHFVVHSFHLKFHRAVKGGGLHGRQKRVKAQSESSKSVVNSVLISREMPVFPGFLEIIRVVTLNKMAESLNGINGAAVLIDDLSLAPNAIKKDIDGMVYILESGKEKERMRTKSFDRDPAVWFTSIIFSAEEPLLSLCNPEQEGAVGRLMELDISPEDLFTDATEANKIAELSHKHYGLMADEFVKRLIANNTLDNLSSLYDREMYRVKADYSGVLARVAQNVAIITLCGELLNQLFMFNFKIADVEKYLMSTAKDNLDNFRISQKGNVIMQTVYTQLIEYARKSCPDENKGLTDHVVISSKATKAMLTQLQRDLGYKPIEVKRALKEGGVLHSNDGPYSYVGTINGKSFRGLYLYIKEIKETEASE